MKDRTGKKINSENYTVKYKNNKSIGDATVIVTLRGAYKGTLKSSFKIIPKGTKLKSVQAASNKLIVTWKKQTVQTKGYQIEYAQNAAFTKGLKKVLIRNTDVTVAELPVKQKGTYYLRIRTIAKPADTPIFSEWSKTITITKHN